MLPCNRTPRPIFYPFSATCTEGERPCTLQPQPISRHLIWLRTTTGGTLNATWRVESVSLPIEQVEVVVRGLAVDGVNTGKTLSATGTTQVKVTNSTWIALRVRGSYREKASEIAARTRAIQILTGVGLGKERPTPAPCWSRLKMRLPMWIGLNGYVR